MKYTYVLVSCLISLCAVTWKAHSKEPPPATRNEIGWAQEFLRASYPGLAGKNYALTVETYLAYDQPGENIERLRMDVGEGPKDWLKGYSGGCLYSITPTPLPWPKELDPAPPPPQSVISPSPRDERCKQGPVYPKQFLTAGFQFDKEGRLMDFAADGSFIDDRKAANEVYEIVRAHPEMTYAEVVATMKQHGTKYGPNDKEQFIKDLPLKQLEPFLGKLQIVSVSFPEMDKDPNPVPWVDRWLSPDWTVKAQATTKDGSKVPYELHFSHLNGYLIGLLDCRTSPWCNRD
jgi:hypothetical protein